MYGSRQLRPVQARRLARAVGRRLAAVSTLRVDAPSRRRANPRPRPWCATLASTNWPRGMRSICSTGWRTSWPS